jgi:hypothetical protein
MVELEIVPSVKDRFSHIILAIDAVLQELHGISEDALARISHTVERIGTPNQ